MNPDFTPVRVVGQVVVSRMSDGSIKFEASTADMILIYGLLEAGKDAARKMATGGESPLLVPRSGA